MAVDGYGHWLTWLERTGQLDPASTPASRATRERVQAYAEAAALRLAPMTVQTRVNDLSRSLRAIAPGHDWKWIARAADRLRSQAVPVREKRSRMQDAQTVVGLGIQIMDRARASDPHFAVQRAILYRDGLMIALLMYRPLRMRSYAALTLEQHLVRRGDAWWMALSGTDTKTGRPMEMPFPVPLAAMSGRQMDKVSAPKRYDIEKYCKHTSAERGSDAMSAPPCTGVLQANAGFN